MELDPSAARDRIPVRRELKRLRLRPGTVVHKDARITDPGTGKVGAKVRVVRADAKGGIERSKPRDSSRLRIYRDTSVASRVCQVRHVRQDQGAIWHLGRRISAGLGGRAVGRKGESVQGRVAGDGHFRMHRRVHRDGKVARSRPDGAIDPLRSPCRLGEVAVVQDVPVAPGLRKQGEIA